MGLLDPNTPMLFKVTHAVVYAVLKAKLHVETSHIIP